MLCCIVVSDIYAMYVCMCACIKLKKKKFYDSSLKDSNNLKDTTKDTSWLKAIDNRHLLGKKWNHTQVAVAIPALQPFHNPCGSNGETVQQVSPQIAGRPPGFQLSQLVQQNLQAPLASLIGSGKIQGH